MTGQWIPRARRAALLFALGLSCSAGAAFAQSPTFARTNYPFLGNDHNVGDFNGDGRIDLTGTGLLTARVMLGNGDGTFQSRVESPATSVGQVQALAPGDFDGDGLLDLLVTINHPDIGVAYLAGRGDGTFDAPVAFVNTARSDSPAVLAVDLDNDLHLDAVIGHSLACYTAPCAASRVITVMLGNGDGTFRPARLIDVGSTTAAISAGDFNRDGQKDLALASDSSRVHVLLGAGDGSFTQRTLTLVPELNLGMDNTDIDTADLNGDRIDDLVVAMALNGSKTVILIGNGDGTFATPRFIQEPGLNVPQYQAIADYNGDRNLDLAMTLANGNSGLMEIRNGNGDGTFGPAVMYLVPPQQSSIGGLKIHATDFNNDGKPDLSMTWGGASTGLAALRNSTGVTPPATPSTPTLVSPSDGATVAQPVTLDWSNVTNATSYEVQVDNSSTISAPFVANPIVSVSQVQLSGLPAQRLWWRVRARNSAGVFGPFSSTRRFTPQTGTTPQPSPTPQATSTPQPTATPQMTPTPTPPGSTASLTVSATGRSGERVTSSPSGINVNVGSTGSASFGVGTSITLSATNSRDVIWSGACSSGGNKTKTCRFTLNANASVTANVQ